MIDTSVADHFIKEAFHRLKDYLNYYMVEPKLHLDSYSNSSNLFKHEINLFL